MIADDGDLVGKKCICYEISKSKYNQTADFINNYPREYRLLSQNCMDFTEAVAEELDLELALSGIIYLYNPKIRLVQ